MCPTPDGNTLPKHYKPCNKPWMCKFCPKPNQTRQTVSGREYNGPAKYTYKTENVIYPQASANDRTGRHKSCT